MTQQKIEASRLDNISTLLSETQIKTWDAVHRIAAGIKPGMRESEAIRFAQKTLAEMGSRKFWHKCHIRFGAGTTKSFNDDYDDYQLRDEDIFYIDIGPIWGEIEGDAGSSFEIGSNERYKKCVQDVQEVFREVSDHWRHNGVNGKELYEFAQESAKNRGWILAPSYVRGHRLAEFPHSFHSELNLEEIEFHPSPKRWVLEIHICDQDLKFGAFHEDLLE